jgi:NitT/TauT family transport system substrate-binding protein
MRIAKLREGRTGHAGNSSITSVFMPSQRVNAVPKAIAALICSTALVWAVPTLAADLVSVGSVDATSANLWPLHIAQKNGYFDAANLQIDLIFAQSNASVIQQLAAGSYAVAPSAGMVDPIRAIDKGAPVALVRIVIQSPPYALLAKPEIKTIEDLKGKTIIIGGAKDITRIFTERMLEPHGLKTGDYDYVFAGATSARFSALKSGAVDAALLTVPFNFYAETEGYTNLGFTFDYLPDMPFAGMAVNRDWAAANTDVLKRFLDCYNKGVAWFDDPNNHEAAVKLQMEVSKIGRDDVEKSYSFLRDKNLFEPTGKVSKRKVGNVIDALRGLGDLPADFTVDRLLLPGVTQISD